MSETPKGAILQRDKKTYAIVPRVPMGILTPEILEGLARGTRKFSIPLVKITSGQRIALVGIKPEDVDKIWEELGMDIGPAEGLCVHYVQACPGTDTCKFGQGNSIGLGGRLEKSFVGKMGSLPAKTKIAISGCKLNCAESFIRDVGAVATPEGWSVVVGGNSGGRPRVGQVIAENLTEDEAFELITKCIEYYSKNGKHKERMPRFVERVGIEEYKKNVL